jgi:hypothetical protein
LCLRGEKRLFGADADFDKSTTSSSGKNHSKAFVFAEISKNKYRCAKLSNQ